MLITIVAAFGHLGGGANAQSDAVVQKMLSAEYCINAYAFMVFVDGAPGPHSTPIAMV